MVIPTGSPSTSKNNSLSEFETNGKHNENQCRENGSVSLQRQKERIAETKIAAPTVIGSSNQSSRVITTAEQYQVAESDAIRTAALWYAANHSKRSGALIPFIRTTFHLSPLEAIRALQLGRKLAQEARQS
ncbi:hypothetical protein [Brucella sp. NBRC 14130]|uniref:hypothetical protein n=1 Tax=Brucella sp. NBRC 14130 TaxID=3075483 RepID=UPI00333E3E20